MKTIVSRLNDRFILFGWSVRLYPFGHPHVSTERMFHNQWRETNRNRVLNTSSVSRTLVLSVPEDFNRVTEIEEIWFGERD